MNHTLTHLPYPVHDAFDCMQRAERPRAVAALGQIQNCVARNRTSSAADEANCKRMFAGGILQQLEKAQEGTVAGVVDAAQALSLDPFPSRMTELVEEFVAKFRVEGGRMIAENISRTIGGDLNATSRRAEQLAVSRLQEVLTEQARLVFSEWKWREMCETVESELSRTSIGGSGDACSLGRTSSVGTGSPAASSSPFTPKRTAHRPRSIIGDPLEAEQGIDLDRPPKPSALLHLQKARPRKRGGGAPPITDDVMITSKSSGTPEELMEDVIEEEEEPKSRRIAMIPDLSQIHLRPSAEREQAESPPPLPQRNRVGPGGAPPPLLPPKPEPRTRLIGGIGSPTTPPATGAADDDENANSRRSVADMAKIFQK
uniref:CLASP_N domain-containing protein n=1 Tax=Caenorhabditis tropicalis TaxID=1561998 RepID=A0A1I7U4H0_9PELO